MKCEYSGHTAWGEGPVVAKVFYRLPLACGCSWAESVYFCEGCLGRRMISGPEVTVCREKHRMDWMANILRIEEVSLPSAG